MNTQTMLFTICRSLIDAVGLTVFHASQYVWIVGFLQQEKKRQLKQICQCSLQKPMSPNDWALLAYCCCFMYGDIPGLGGNGALIILYTQETSLSFSHSKVKWNGELLCNTINSLTVNLQQQQQFISTSQGNYKSKNILRLYSLVKVIYKHLKYCI